MHESPCRRKGGAQCSCPISTIGICIEGISMGRPDKEPNPIVHLVSPNRWMTAVRPFDAEQRRNYDAFMGSHRMMTFCLHSRDCQPLMPVWP